MKCEIDSALENTIQAPDQQCFRSLKSPSQGTSWKKFDIRKVDHQTSVLITQPVQVQDLNRCKEFVGGSTVLNVRSVMPFAVHKEGHGRTQRTQHERLPQWVARTNVCCQRWWLLQSSARWISICTAWVFSTVRHRIQRLFWTLAVAALAHDGF